MGNGSGEGKGKGKGKGEHEAKRLMGHRVASFSTEHRGEGEILKYFF